MLSIKLNPDKLLTVKIPERAVFTCRIETALKKAQFIFFLSYGYFPEDCQNQNKQNKKLNNQILTLQERRSDPQVHTRPRQIINHLVLY
jgi:hypothetical protein